MITVWIIPMQILRNLHKSSEYYEKQFKIIENVAKRKKMLKSKTRKKLLSDGSPIMQ